MDYRKLGYYVKNIITLLVVFFIGIFPSFSQNDEQEGSDFENAEIAETRVFQLERTSGEGFELENHLDRFEVYDFNFEELYTHVNSNNYMSTFATTVALSNDVPIETLSKLLGHSKLSTTQIYARVLDDKIGRDVSKLQDVLNIDERNAS